MWHKADPYLRRRLYYLSCLEDPEIVCKSAAVGECEAHSWPLQYLTSVQKVRSSPKAQELILP